MLCGQKIEGLTVMKHLTHDILALNESDKDTCFLQTRECFGFWIARIDCNKTIQWIEVSILAIAFDTLERYNIRGQCYKIFYSCKLWISVISWSVRPLQVENVSVFELQSLSIMNCNLAIQWNSELKVSIWKWLKHFG